METSDNKYFNRIKIKEVLDDQHLYFEESDSRMNYGFIGGIFYDDEIIVSIFRKTFYVRVGSFPLNEENLKMISSIQHHYAELTIDDKNRAVVNKLDF